MLRTTLTRFSFATPRRFVPIPGARAVTALVWAIAVAVAVYWGLRLASSAEGASTPAVAMSPAPVPDDAAISRMLGAAPAAASAPVVVRAKAELKGVVALGADGAAGAALIAIDDKAAAPFRVGAEVTDGYHLASLDTERAVLSADGKADWVLKMPTTYSASGAATPAMRGSLPVAPAGAAPAPSRPGNGSGPRLLGRPQARQQS